MKMIIDISDDQANQQIEDLDENLKPFSEYLKERIFEICNNHDIEIIDLIMEHEQG